MRFIGYINMRYIPQIVTKQTKQPNHPMENSGSAAGEYPKQVSVRMYLCCCTLWHNGLWGTQQWGSSPALISVQQTFAKIGEPYLGRARRLHSVTRLSAAWGRFEKK